jgi:uncharacterized membrane protein
LFDHSTVPDGQEAVSVTLWPGVTAVAEAVTVGAAAGTTETEYTGELGLKQLPLWQVTEYPVVTVGLTVIEVNVWPVFQRGVREQPSTVNVTVSPGQITDSLHTTVGVGTVVIVVRMVFERGVPQAVPTRQIA